MNTALCRALCTTPERKHNATAPLGVGGLLGVSTGGLCIAGGLSLLVADDLAVHVLHIANDAVRGAFDPALGLCSVVLGLACRGGEL